MPNDWERRTLIDVAEVIISNVDKKTKDDETPVRLCNYTDVYYNQFIRRDMAFMSATAKEREIKKCTLFKGDVIITKDSEKADDIGVPAYIRENIDNLVCGYHLVMLRPKPDLVDGAFLFYALSDRPAQVQFHAKANGITRFGLRKNDIESVEVPIPPLAVQRQIGVILASLEDKIDLNRRMNRTLERMAQALFKSWFIDFTPVRAKADGDPTAGGLPDHLADLFPDRLVDSELGEIPEGWTTGVLGDIAEQVLGGQWGSDTQDEETVPAICLRGCDMEDLRAVGNAPKAPVRFIKPTAIQKRLPSKRDVLIAASGAGPCGRPLWCAKDIALLYSHPVVYSNFVKRFQTPSPAHAVFLDRFLFRKFEDRSIHDYITGTSVPNLDAAGLLKTCPLVIPTEEVLAAYHSFCRPMFQRLYGLQNVTLAHLRDTLLPKLLSGELEVPEAEAAVEEMSS
jgi:type I restriction enzyme S subunit